jgi:hypothetical protein
MCTLSSQSESVISFFLTGGGKLHLLHKNQSNLKTLNYHSLYALMAPMNDSVSVIRAVQ